jgi:hypothetical protein
MSHTKPHTWIDLIPIRLLDPFTDKASWFVDEHDEKGNHYESYEFKTEKQADEFIRLWAEVSEEAAIQYYNHL